MSSVEMYESATGRWTAMPDMTTKRRGSVACAVGSNVIVTGGSSEGEYLNTCEYLDLGTDEEDKKWVMIESMKEARVDFSGVLLDDGVTFLVTGGNNGDQKLASCEQLNTSTMTWSDAPSMSTARSSHCTVLYKKKAVVLGGCDEEYNALAVCEEYDSASKRWSPFPPFIQARAEFGACVLNDQIYVCGGYVNRSISDCVEVYDGVMWRVLDSCLSSSRWGNACVVWKGKVVVIGGQGVKADHVEVYDEVENKWLSEIIPRLSTCRMFLSAVSF